MAKLITIQLAVPAGYQPGDYARLCTNGGSGAVDYNNPVSGPVELFPDGAGLYGFGRAPFGNHRFGRCHSMRTPGFGKLPFGRAPFGHGTVVIRASYRVTACGTYDFGFAIYDSAGNAHSGTPGEVSVAVHVTPAKPTGLTKNSYNKDTDVLTLDAA